MLLQELECYCKNSYLVYNIATLSTFFVYISSFHKCFGINISFSDGVMLSVCGGFYVFV